MDILVDLIGSGPQFKLDGPSIYLAKKSDNSYTVDLDRTRYVFQLLNNLIEINKDEFLLAMLKI